MIWSACVFYLDLLEYDCCTSRHRPQSERNCIRQQYREDFIGLPIPTKQIQFPDTSQQKQHNVSLADCLPHLHVLDNRQHCAQLSDACWTPDREQGELEQMFLMRSQSVCSWSSNALTLNHIAFKLCCSVISKSCQDGITTQQQSMSHPRYLVNNDNLYSGQWTGMAMMVGWCCHTRFMTCMYYPGIPGAGGEMNLSRFANAVQSHS